MINGKQDELACYMEDRGVVNHEDEHHQQIINREITIFFFKNPPRWGVRPDPYL